MRISNLRTAIVAVALAAVLASLVSAAQNSTALNYFDQCSGGASTCDNVLNLGGTWKVGGTAISSTAATLNTATTGVAAGYKIARGTITLDGSNPSSAAHGLTTVVACTLTNIRSTAPGDEVAVMTYAISGANLDVYAWTNTGGTDPTLAASTDANDVIAWICVGT